MMRPVSDLDVAAAVRVSARALELASEAEHEYAEADSLYPSPYAAALAAVQRHLIEAGNAEALQVAVAEFDYRAAQSQEAKDYQLRRWEAEYAEKTRRHELALQGDMPFLRRRTRRPLPDHRPHRPQSQGPGRPQGPVPGRLPSDPPAGQ